MKVSSVIQIILFRAIAISGQYFGWCEFVDDGVAVIPKDAVKIPDNAFMNCPGPFSIMIPASVKTIGGRAFTGSGLTSIEFLGDDDIGLSESLLEEIGTSAFSYCTKLEKITVPASVTSIGNGAFYMSGLTSISFDDDILLEEIGDAAFWGCKALKSITLPASVMSIGGSAFEESGLSSIDFEVNSSLDEIGDSAFKGCKFKRIALPKSVINIGANAFKDCKNLTEFKIPTGVVTIGNGAFKGCEELKSVKIPTIVATRLW